ncbi:hypothetical protein JCM10207_004478 [Rhodosporidiobolus poonsookiae]
MGRKAKNRKNAAQPDPKPSNPLPASACFASTFKPQASPYRDAIDTALYHLSVGDIGVAYKVLAAARPTLPTARQHPNTVDYVAWLMYSVRQRVEKKEWKGALNHLDKAEKAMREQEKPWEWTRFRLEALHGSRRWKELEAVASTLLPIHPGHAQLLLYYRTLAKYNGANLDEALEVGEKARDAKADNPFLTSKISTLLDTIRRSVELKEEGKKAFQTGEYKEAVKRYTVALSIDLANKALRAVLLNNRALAHFKAGDFHSAISDCNACVNLDPKYVKALHTRAKAKDALGDLAGALSSLETARTHAPVGSTERENLEAELKKLKERKAAKDQTRREKEEERWREEEARRRKKREERQQDHYAILGVSRKATLQEIRTAYKRQALKHHPDKGGDEKEFQKVAAAYEVLGDEFRKERYDFGDDDCYDDEYEDDDFYSNTSAYYSFFFSGGGRSGGL